MKNENISKRPKSGKHLLLRPLKNTFKDKNNEKEQYNNIFYDNINLLKKDLMPIEEKFEKNNSKYSNKNIKKKKIINSLVNKEIKNTYNTILESNLKKFDDINEKKEKLKNINLIEKNIDDLYDWSNLLNNSRPLSCYISNRKPLNIQKEKKIFNHTAIECNKNTKNSMKKNNQKKLTISMISPRKNSYNFSHNKTMNDYFKRYKNNYSERIQFLKPKLKTNSFKLKNQIKTQRILSAQKERELINKSNIEEIKLEKKDLIRATERNNPIPLLQSIFKQIYSEDESDKLYYNSTIRTSNLETNFDNPTNINKIDTIKKVKYNKSEIYNYNNMNNINKNNINSKGKLILSYYNQDDAYIQIFNRIMANNSKYNNDNAFNENEKIYNPILQKFDENYNPKKLLLINKSIQNKNNEKKEDDLKTNKINQKVKNLKNIRPKTGFKPPNTIINNPWAKRPQTSNIRKYQQAIEPIFSNYDKSTDLANSFNNNSFPIKTSTNTGNIQSDNMNKIIKERKLNMNNINYDYTNEAKEFNNNIPSKKRNIKKNLSFNKTYRNTNNNKWNNINYNKNKRNSVNFYDFEDVVNNLLSKHNNNNLYSMNYYKRMGGKYYSSSNNINIKKMRNEKNKKFKNIHTDFIYSKEAPQNVYIDESISTYKQNYSFQKI